MEQGKGWRVSFYFDHNFSACLEWYVCSVWNGTGVKCVHPSYAHCPWDGGCGARGLSLSLTLFGGKRQLSGMQCQLQGGVLLRDERLEVQGQRHDVLPDLKQKKALIHTSHYSVRHISVQAQNRDAGPAQALSFQQV